MRLLKRLSNIPFVAANARFGPSTFVRIAFSPIRSKVASLILGPSGLGVFGTAQTFQMLGSSFTSLGVGQGLTSRVGESVSSSDRGRLQEAVNSTWTLLFGVNIFFVAALLLSAHPLAELVFGKLSSGWVLVPIILSLPFYSLGPGYLEPILYGTSNDGGSARAYTRTAFVEVVLFSLLTFFFGLKGALYTLLFSPLTLFFFLLWEVKRLAPTVRLFHFGWRSEVARFLLRVGSTMLFGGMMLYSVNLFIRSTIAKNLGDATNGHYQVLLALAALYTPFLTNAVWVRLFPQVGAKGLVRSVALEWGEAMGVTVVVAATVQIALLTAPDLIIRILYTKDFLPVIGYLPYRAFGDFFFLLAQPALGVLLGLHHHKRYLLGAVGAPLLFAGLAFLWKSSLEGIMIAYCVAQVLLGVYAMGVYFTLNRRFSELRKIALPLLVTVVFGAAFVAIQGYLLISGAPLWWRILFVLGVGALTLGAYLTGHFGNFITHRWLKISDGKLTKSAKFLRLGIENRVNIGKSDADDGVLYTAAFADDFGEIKISAKRFSLFLPPNCLSYLGSRAIRFEEKKSTFYLSEYEEMDSVRTSGDKHWVIAEDRGNMIWGSTQALFPGAKILHVGGIVLAKPALMHLLFRNLLKQGIVRITGVLPSTSSFMFRGESTAEGESFLITGLNTDAVHFFGDSLRRAQRV